MGFPTAMESSVQTLIDCTQTLKPAIGLTGVGLGDLQGAIGRAIVPNEEFKVVVGLRQDAGDSAGKVGRSAVDGEKESYIHKKLVLTSSKSELPSL